MLRAAGDGKEIFIVLVEKLSSTNSNHIYIWYILVEHDPESILLV